MIRWVSKIWPSCDSMQYTRCARRGDHQAHPAHTYRKRIKLAPEKAIFIFVDDILPPTAALMSSIYDEHK